MKTRLAALAGSLLIAGSLSFVAVSAVVAITPPVGNAGPSGKGVCAPQAAAAQPSGGRAAATLDTLKAFGDCEINRRLTTLDDLSAKITSSKTITSSDASSLQTEIAASKSGLTNLKATIDADTTVVALKADIVKIASDYRVYLLVVPQVGLTIGADTVLATQSKFADVNTKLQAAIDKAKAASKDVTKAQADLDAMNAAVASAVSLASPIPGEVIPLKPAQYDNGTLTAARTALGQARDKIKAALADAKACRADLAALK